MKQADATATRETAAGLLQVLALWLGRGGWYARLDTTSPGRPPRLYVANLHGPPRTEHVIAAPCADQTWWFCFERGDPIATTAELDTTVDRISHALSGPRNG